MKYFITFSTGDRFEINKPLASGEVVFFLDIAGVKTSETVTATIETDVLNNRIEYTSV